MKNATLMLVLCCLLWGYSFPVMQLSMKALEGHYFEKGGLSSVSVHVQGIGLNAGFLGWRFGLAALLTALGWREARRGYSRLEVTSGGWLGVFFIAGMICQIAGLRYTLPSVSSFITSISVVFTPLAQAVIFRRAVAGRTWFGVALALCGLIILAQPNPGACENCQVLPVPPFPYFGEALTTLGAIFFTGLVLGLDHMGSRCNPVRMSVAMFCSSSVIGTLISALLCGSALYRSEVIGGLVRDTRFVALLFTLTLFSSVFAIQLMYRFQKFVSPAVASVVYSTEAVFSLIFSLLFRTENLTLLTAVGGGLILAAFVLVTLPGGNNSKPEPVL